MTRCVPFILLALLQGCAGDGKRPGPAPDTICHPEKIVSAELNLLLARIHEGLFGLSQRYAYLADYQDFDLNRWGAQWRIQFSGRNRTGLSIGYEPIDYQGHVPGCRRVDAGYHNHFRHLVACRFPGLGAKLRGRFDRWEDAILLAEIESLVARECRRTQYHIRAIF